MDSIARQITSYANKSNIIKQIFKSDTINLEDCPKVAVNQNNSINTINIRSNGCKKREVTSNPPVLGHIGDTVKRCHGTKVSSKNLKLPPGTTDKPVVNKNDKATEGLSKLDIHGRK